MKNLGLKLWSIVIALALTIFVHGQGNRSVISLIVPVELRNLSSDRIVLLPNAPQAQVTVRGPSYVLSDLSSEPLSFSVRVPEEVGNRYVTPLQSTMLQLPPSVEVANIDPSEIEFVLDTIIEKEIKIEVPRIGSLREDYRLVGITVIPPTIKVRGPKTELESLESIETEQIDLRSFTSSADKVLNIKERGRFVQIEPKKVNVRVEVNSIAREKRFRDVPVNIENGVDGRAYSLEPGKISLELSGPKGVINKLTKKDLNAYVEMPEDFGSVGVGVSTELPVKLSLPDRVELAYVTPELVRVSVK